jgi:hypothetical protein
MAVGSSDLIYATPFTSMQQGALAGQKIQQNALSLQDQQQSASDQGALRNALSQGMSGTPQAQSQAAQQLSQSAPGQMPAYTSAIQSMNGAQRAQMQQRSGQIMQTLSSIANIPAGPQREQAYQTSLDQEQAQGNDVSQLRNLPSDQGMRLAYAHAQTIDQTLKSMTPESYNVAPGNARYTTNPLNGTMSVQEQPLQAKMVEVQTGTDPHGNPIIGKFYDNGPGKPLTPLTAPGGYGGGQNGGGGFLGSLPAETQAYVPSVMQRLGGQAAFDANGQPTQALIQAVSGQESGGNPNAVSKAGAQGVMQLMPATAASVGVTDPFNSQQNIAGGTKYLGQLYQQFNGNVPAILAAYNAGPGATQRAMSGQQFDQQQQQQPPPPQNISSTVQPVSGLSGQGMPAQQVHSVMPQDQALPFGSSVKMPAGSSGAVTTLTPAEVGAAGLPEGTVAQRAPDGKISVVSKGDSGYNANAPQPFGNSQLTGPAYLASIDDKDRATVVQVLQGRASPPTGSAARSSYWMGIINAVNKADPTFDTTDYQKRYKTAQAYSPSGPAGQQITALNTLIQHIGGLQNSYQAIGNTGSPMINSAKNYLGYQTGLGGNGLKSYELNAHAAAQEVESLWKKGGGNQADIEVYGDKLSSANDPTTENQVLSKMLELAGGRLHSLHDVYQNAMGNSGVPLQFVNDGSLKTMQQIDPALAGEYQQNAHAGTSGSLAGNNNPSMPSAPQQASAQPSAVNPQTQNNAVSYSHLWGG